MGASHSQSISRYLAKSVNPLGPPAFSSRGNGASPMSARYLTRDESLANGMLNTAAAYIASDLVAVGT